MKFWLSFRLMLSLTYVAVHCMAQGAASADLHVTVKDPHGAVVNNAKVTVRSPNRNIERVSSRGTDGEYIFLALPPDNYALTIEGPGFAKVLVPALQLTVGQAAEFTVALRMATMSDDLTVTSAMEMVETERTSATTTVGQQQIANLPINGRNYINFALTDSKLARDAGPFIGAAPTSGITFVGQRPRANLINVDGADAVDNSVNGIRSTVSQEAVQEFQIQTGNFGAEYGRAAGGVVNIITKSGSSELHGSAFAYLRNRHLQAVNPFSAVNPVTHSRENPPYTRVQAGVAVGGPLNNNTFYFFSYEGTRRRETGFSSIGFDNFGLMPLDTTPLAPLLALGGNSFGTVLLTPDQIKFINGLVTASHGLTPAQQPAFLSLVQGFLPTYLTMAAGGSGIALDGILPSSAMLPVVTAIATRNSLPAPISLAAFPSSGASLPVSFATLNSVRGNYPVTEDTDLFSLRLDHQFTRTHSGTLRVGLSPAYVTGLQNSATGVNFGQSAGSRAAEQTYRDWTANAQDSWAFGPDKINELRFQYAYRGLLYNHSRAPGGSGAGVNIGGVAVFGREPISYVDRTEERYQFTDVFSASRAGHTFKLGVDINLLPMSAVYTMQFGGLYTFGNLRAGSLLSDPAGVPFDQLDLSPFGLGYVPVPGFNSVQGYGLGVPQAFAQGVGDPREQASNKTFGGFLQDAWRLRPNLTLNYGIRYDVELTPELRAINAMSEAAERAMGVMEGIPRDMNNFAPRVGVAWDPKNKGRSVVRASYGIFYDHPPMSLVFSSDVLDGAQAPQIALFGGAPGCSSNKNALNATNAFQGLLGCLPTAFNYVPAEQRFNPTPNAPSIFVDQQYLAAGVPLLMQPVTLPVSRNFQYAYVNQANVGVEHQLGRNLSFTVEYNFNGGRNLNRPRNANPANGELLKLNYDRALAAVNALAGMAPPTLINQLRPADPLSVAVCPAMLRALGFPPVWGNANFVPAALVSFFRPSGMNNSLLAPSSPFTSCAGNAEAALQEFGLGASAPVPFSDMHANFSDASSNYHGFTANLRKRMSNHYELLASYTWSHAIDDGSTDLQSGVGPQDARRPNLERANSLFDQRQRFVLSAIVESGSRFNRGFARVLNAWTVAAIVEVGSGRPFNILTYTDRNFDFVPTSDRPMVVPPGTEANACGDSVISSRYSPAGYLQLPCYNDATPSYTGSLGRNAGTKPWTMFADIRLARRFRVSDRMTIESILDVFNAANRFNVLDVNPLYSSAGVPTASFDPRQFQLAIRLSW